MKSLFTSIIDEVTQAALEEEAAGKTTKRETYAEPTSGNNFLEFSSNLPAGSWDDSPATPEGTAPAREIEASRPYRPPDYYANEPEPEPEPVRSSKPLGFKRFSIFAKQAADRRRAAEEAEKETKREYYARQPTQPNPVPPLTMQPVFSTPDDSGQLYDNPASGRVSPEEQKALRFGPEPEPEDSGQPHGLERWSNSLNRTRQLAADRRRTAQRQNIYEGEWLQWSGQEDAFTEPYQRYGTRVRPPEVPRGGPPPARRPQFRWSGAYNPAVRPTVDNARIGESFAPQDAEEAMRYRGGLFPEGRGDDTGRAYRPPDFYAPGGLHEQYTNKLAEINALEAQLGAIDTTSEPFLQANPLLRTLYTELGYIQNQYIAAYNPSYDPDAGGGTSPDPAPDPDGGVNNTAVVNPDGVPFPYQRHDYSSGFKYTIAIGKWREGTWNKLFHGPDGD